MITMQNTKEMDDVFEIFGKIFNLVIILFKL
jgi:hypothetical protein